MSELMRVIETREETGARRYVPNTVRNIHGGWSLNYTAQDAANEVSFRDGRCPGFTYEVVPAPELDAGLARDEDGILCRYCVPAHGTIGGLLRCRCVAQCGGAGCTGALLSLSRESAETGAEPDDAVPRDQAAVYVVTFDPRPVAGPGAIDGLRRMPLDGARGVLTEAGRIPKHGRIVNADTLRVED